MKMAPLAASIVGAIVGGMVVNSCASTNESHQYLDDLPLSAELGGDTSRPLATDEAFTFVAANADEATRASFVKGNEIFSQRWLPIGSGADNADGLGPIFNRAACTDCHIKNGRGRAPAEPDATLQSVLLRISKPQPSALHGRPESVPAYGTQIQDRAIAGVLPEARIRVHWEKVSGQFGDDTVYQLRRPRIEVSETAYGPLPDDTLFSLRVASPMIGLGLLELIPAQTLSQLADPEDADKDGISGRVNRVPSLHNSELVVGRFGWKANSATLEDQNSAAALDDIGITSMGLPEDNCLPEQRTCLVELKHEGAEMSAEAMNALTTYTRWLAVPRQRGANRADVRDGFAVFVGLGCDGCHIPSLMTGIDEQAPELSGQLIHPFTDLLLHDMGEGLADGRPDFLASGREWRTPPLWGIGLTKKVSGHTEFLHDGRARSLQEAILWHAGEAQNSRDQFRGSSAQQRLLLLEFLNSL